MQRTRLCDFKILYRVRQGCIHIDLDSSLSALVSTKINPELIFDRFIVLKETRHTYLLHELWLTLVEDGDFYDPDEYVSYTEKKRMYKNATNRFAWETKELAMADYARKQQYRRKRLIQELEECNANIEKALRYIHGDDKNNVY